MQGFTDVSGGTKESAIEINGKVKEENVSLQERIEGFEKD